MKKATRPLGLVLIVSLLTWLSPASSASASNEVFLSNDTAQSEVTYVVQFETTVKGHLDKIRITLPPGTNAANARLGRLIIGDKLFEGEDDHKNDATLSVDALDPNTLIVDLRDERDVKAGTKILVELFNLNNPVAGDYAIDVRTLKKNSSVLEVIPPIAYSTFAGSGTGDITAVNTPAGSGLTGGAASGDVTLSLQLCAAGQVLKSQGTTWACAPDNDTNSGGTVTSVGTGAGLTGGPITATGTISVATGGITSAMLASNSVDSSKIADGTIQFSDWSSNSCANNQVPKWNGTAWTCANDDNSGGTVTVVTATAPLTSSGGTTPNISLPNVIIGTSNTAIGTSALSSNTTGNGNTASGNGALQKNTSGNFNTASGVSALTFNTTGSGNTAIGNGANVSTGNLTNATAIGNGAVVDASNKIRLGDANVTLVETHGDIRVGAGTAVGCVQDGDGTVIAGSCLSDARLKTDVRSFSPLLDKLALLQPVHFRWKPEVAPELQLGEAESFGLIAQDAEKVLPELVTEDYRGYKAVRYNMLPVMLLQALKEQQAIIQQQRSENADLKARLERLEQMVKEKPYLTASAEPVQ